MGNLLVYDRHRFHVIDTSDYSSRKTSLVVENIDVLAGLPNRGFTVENDTLYRFDLKEDIEDYWRLGRAGDYASTTAMCGHKGFLYVIDNDALWCIEPEQGRHLSVGGVADWPGKEHFICGVGESLLIIENERLWRVHAKTGEYEALSRPYGWVGTKALASFDDRAFAVCNDTLWEIRPEDGLQRPLSDETFPGHVMMAANENGVYVVANGYLYRYDPETNETRRVSKTRAFLLAGAMVAV